MKEDGFLGMYDFVVVTHIPAFYKVNLYNELSKKISIFVIFLAENTRENRSEDFITLGKANFNYVVLSKENFQSRSIISNIFKLTSLLIKLKYDKILVSGWDLLEFWVVVIFNSLSKTCLALESTIIESRYDGISGILKRIFLQRISLVFASGSRHVQLLECLNFSGEIRITNGVGIINLPEFTQTKKAYEKKFIYVGRISKVKNLNLLVTLFNELEDYSLAIVGEGDELFSLKKFANSNITFLPSVVNNSLKHLFLDYNIFILPSLSETWGLVVEEALYFGLPVIISENCGSVELIEESKNGYIFNPNNINSLKECLKRIDQPTYDRLTEYIGSSFKRSIFIENKVGPYVI